MVTAGEVAAGYQWTAGLVEWDVPAVGRFAALFLGGGAVGVQEVVGGLADVRIPARLLDEVRDLPGVVAVSEENGKETPRVFGGVVGAPPRAG